MSSTGSNKHNKRLASEADASQELQDTGPVQNLKLKDRRRFSKEVQQQDGDNFLPSAYLQVDGRKPPMGSISSMEVNVDVLEQMDLMDLMDVSDHEALDVFLSEGARSSPLPDAEEEEEEDDEEAEVVHRERVPLRRQHEVSCGSRRSFSTSSGSSDASAGGAQTPVVQSDDEEVHADNVLLTSVPQTRDQETDEEDDGERCN